MNGLNEANTTSDAFEHDMMDKVAPPQASMMEYIPTSMQEREELVYKLIASLPRSSLARLQRRIAPLVQLDVVGLLPTEVALQIFAHLSWKSLLQCSLVSRRWRILADDSALWKRLCHGRGWAWKETPPHQRMLEFLKEPADMDDEGMGDEELDVNAAADGPWRALDDSGFASFSEDMHAPRRRLASRQPERSALRHSAPAAMASPSAGPSARRRLRPDYKLLYETHVRIHHRVLRGAYRLSTLQGAPHAHSNTIYCVQLHTYANGLQTLFTGSKDRTVKEWDLGTGAVRRVVAGVHDASVLSICVHDGLLASGGSDRRVALWDLERDEQRGVLRDHEDSVLCVRFDERRLVSCSKDRTVRVYLLPDLEPQFVLRGHRAAVNAVAISPEFILSASGDRSIRLWDAESGDLLRPIENHHSRGIAAVHFEFPYVLSGSSDKHIRLFDLQTGKGWSTSPEFDPQAVIPPSFAPASLDEDDEDGDTPPAALCVSCAAPLAVTAMDVDGPPRRSRAQGAHGDLVRSVAMSQPLVVSGSYDATVKIWDRKTGQLVADLTGGHTGRIFSVAFDVTKVISCGEDQRICIWDFAHGMDTSFIKL